ncbi:MAG: DUF1579 family protein [Planctomycetota bacterium]
MLKALLLAVPALAAAPLLTAPTTSPAASQEVDYAAMMEAAKKYTQPGKYHELLEKFIGDWETTCQITMGPQPGKPEPGTARFEWKVEGRWIEGVITGSMMGMPLTSYSWIGYDNFKQSYVWTRIADADTAMTAAEGDLTPDGKSLIMYGTLDEYLTGEHDKMVKYAWRFVSDDEIVLEVHDLPIGEVNTKVIEFRYRRAKGGK